MRQTLYFRFVTSLKHNDRPAQHLSCLLNTVHQRWMTKWPKGIRGLASMNKTEIKNRGATIFQNSSSHLKILDVREVTRRNFRTEDAQILGATVQNSFITANRRPRIRHPWCAIHFFYNQSGNVASWPKSHGFWNVFGECLVRTSSWTATALSEIFSFFISSQKCRDSTSITSRRIPSTSFPIHCPLTVPTSGANPSEIQRR